uniref:Uncharacterized protein n=1 Tax=Arundo donax TaxID=35708 RepID=A0A0A9C9V3_ARUDO
MHNCATVTYALGQVTSTVPQETTRCSASAILMALNLYYVTSSPLTGALLEDGGENPTLQVDL